VDKNTPDYPEPPAELPEKFISEFALGDNDPLPFPYVRLSRLVYPKGPFSRSWLQDQQQHYKSVLLIPRDRNYRVRLVDLKSLLEHVERLAQAPGPDPKAPYKGWIR
jgi:hypothetical protein